MHCDVDIEQSTKTIRKLCDNLVLRLESGNSNRRLAEEQLDRKNLILRY